MSPMHSPTRHHPASPSGIWSGPRGVMAEESTGAGAGSAAGQDTPGSRGEVGQAGKTVKVAAARLTVRAGGHVREGRAEHRCWLMAWPSGGILAGKPPEIIGKTDPK